MSVGQASTRGPLGEPGAPGEERRPGHEAEVPAVAEQEQGEEQEHATVRGQRRHDGRCAVTASPRDDADAPETVGQPTGDRDRRTSRTWPLMTIQPRSGHGRACHVGRVIVMIGVMTT
jgi:hypothetical protein